MVETQTIAELKQAAADAQRARQAGDMTPEQAAEIQRAYDHALMDRERQAEHEAELQETIARAAAVDTALRSVPESCPAGWAICRISVKDAQYLMMAPAVAGGWVSTDPDFRAVCGLLMAAPAGHTLTEGRRDCTQSAWRAMRSAAAVPQGRYVDDLTLSAAEAAIHYMQKLTR